MKFKENSGTIVRLWQNSVYVEVTPPIHVRSIVIHERQIIEELSDIKWFILRMRTMGLRSRTCFDSKYNNEVVIVKLVQLPTLWNNRAETFSLFT